MIETLLGLLGTLLALLFWWWRRRAARQADPLHRHRLRYENIDREMASTPPGQPAAPRRGLADDLDELERLSRAQSHPRRSTGAPR